MEPHCGLTMIDDADAGSTDISAQQPAQPEYAAQSLLTPQQPERSSILCFRRQRSRHRGVSEELQRPPHICQRCRNHRRCDVVVSYKPSPVPPPQSSLNKFYSPKPQHGVLQFCAAAATMAIPALGTTEFVTTYCNLFCCRTCGCWPPQAGIKPR